MAIWYNPPGKDSKFASIACTNWNEVNTKLEFQELGIKDDDTFYYLFGFAKSASDVVYVKGEKGWKFEPQLVSFKVAKKQYEKWNSTDKKNEPVEQSIVEKFYCGILENLDLNKVYSGRLIFQNIPQIEMVVTGDVYGQPISEEMVKLTIQSMATLTEVESPEHIKLDELKLPPKSSGFGRSSQSEYDKLGDRLRFACEQLKLAFPELKFESVADIQQHFNDPKITVQVQEAWNIIGSLLGK